LQFSYFRLRATAPAASEPRPSRPISGSGEAVCGRFLPLCWSVLWSLAPAVALWSLAAEPVVLWSAAEPVAAPVVSVEVLVDGVAVVSVVVLVLAAPVVLWSVAGAVLVAGAAVEFWLLMSVLDVPVVELVPVVSVVEPVVEVVPAAPVWSVVVLLAGGVVWFGSVLVVLLAGAELWFGSVLEAGAAVWSVVVPEVLAGAAFGSVVVVVVVVVFVLLGVVLLVWANVRPATSTKKSVNRANFRMREAPSGF
jgi:hypothetical protein